MVTDQYIELIANIAAFKFCVWCVAVIDVAAFLSVKFKTMWESSGINDMF